MTKVRRQWASWLQSPWPLCRRTKVLTCWWGTEGGSPKASRPWTGSQARHSFQSHLFLMWTQPRSAWKHLFSVSFWSRTFWTSFKLRKKITLEFYKNIRRNLFIHVKMISNPRQPNNILTGWEPSLFSSYLETTPVLFEMKDLIWGHGPDVFYSHRKCSDGSGADTQWICFEGK